MVLININTKQNLSLAFGKLNKRQSHKRKRLALNVPVVSYEPSRFRVLWWAFEPLA